MLHMKMRIKELEERVAHLEDELILFASKGNGGGRFHLDKVCRSWRQGKRELTRSHLCS